MDFLCTYITPDGYIRLLRMLPMLSTLEIGFDLIGEESIRRTAGNFNSLQDKIRIQGIPERVRTLFLAYLEWAWYVFQELVDAAYRTAYFWDRSVEGPFQSYRKTMQEYDNRAKSSYSVYNLLLAEGAINPEPLRPTYPPEPTYLWQDHLVRGALTALVMYLLTLIPPVGRATGWILSHLEIANAGQPWYLRALNMIIYQPMYIYLLAIAVLTVGGLIWLLGWPVQWALQIILWVFVRLLDSIARILSQRRLYKFLLSLTLLGTVLSVFLPNELQCN